NLHDRTMGASPQTRYCRYRGEALISYNTYLDTPSASCGDDLRDHAAIREIGELQFLVRLVQAAVVRESDEPQVRPKRCILAARNREKHAVEHCFSRLICALSRKQWVKFSLSRCGPVRLQQIASQQQNLPWLVLMQSCRRCVNLFHLSYSTSYR